VRAEAADAVMAALHGEGSAFRRKHGQLQTYVCVQLCCRMSGVCSICQSERFDRTLLGTRTSCCSFAVVRSQHEPHAALVLCKLLVTSCSTVERTVSLCFSVAGLLLQCGCQGVCGG
jgi:hypothetical protein